MKIKEYEDSSKKLCYDETKYFGLYLQKQNFIKKGVFYNESINIKKQVNHFIRNKLIKLCKCYFNRYLRMILRYKYYFNIFLK